MEQGATMRLGPGWVVGPLGATERLPLDGGLKVILWIETILYLGIGLHEIFDDFNANPKWNAPWARNNPWVKTTFRSMVKMHAAVCVLLGYVAASGLYEGEVGRLELELLFLSLALLMYSIWSAMIPFNLWWRICVMKPETYLQAAMVLFYSDLVRPHVLCICLGLNVYALFVRFGPTSTGCYEPFTYAELRESICQAEGPEMAEKIDKLMCAKKPLADMDEQQPLAPTQA